MADWSRRNATRPRKLVLGLLASLLVLGLALGLGQVAVAGGSLIFQVEHGGDVGVTESAGSHHSETYKLKLQSQPSANVTIALTFSPAGQITLDKSTLTFTQSNYNNFQTVTVTAVDDSIQEGDHTATITHTSSSADGSYNGLTSNLTVDIDDNDWVLHITETAGNTNVAEGGATDTYKVHLAFRPGHGKTVTVTLTTDGVATVSPTTLTFSYDNWDDDQTVTVTAYNDPVVEPSPHDGVITHTLASGDSCFSGRVAYLKAHVTDNDTAGVTVSPASILATEGGDGGSYTVVLTSQPTADVTVYVSADAQVTADPTSVSFGAGGEALGASVAFTSTDWDDPQTITVAAVDDSVAEGDHHGTITHEATSDDLNYDELDIDDVTVDITDNDTAGVTVSPASILATEGGDGGSYTVVLTSQPTADVTVYVSADAQVTADPTSVSFGAGGEALGASVAFTSTDWDDPQTITVAAVDDSVAEGDHHGTITHEATSDDLNYDELDIDDVTVDITDNDTAGVTVSPASILATEGGDGGSYTVVLTSQPTADVTVYVSADAQVTADPTSVSFGAGGEALGASVAFTSTDWDDPQTITVAAVDDSVAEGDHHGTITHEATSDDLNYDELDIDDVTVDITDNDTAGVTVSPASISATEGGDGGSYTVVLTSQPTADVTVYVSADAQVTADPTSVSFGAGGEALGASVAFTSTDWDDPQTITVAAVDDSVAEGDHHGTITHEATSDDLNYDELDIDDVTVDITDNDTAGVTVSPASISATEGGDGGSYTVVLTSQPTADVTVYVSADAQVTADPTSVSFGAGGEALGASVAFTSTDWDDPQTITVAAENDLVAEGDHEGTITHEATSDDSNYDELDIDDVTVDITDNDTAGVTVSPASISATEGGDGGSYYVGLTSEPVSPVTISVNPDGQVALTPTSLTFLPGDYVCLATASEGSLWSEPQLVTVTAVDDTAIEGGHTGIITHEASSEDPDYSEISIGSVTVNITDNDFPIPPPFEPEEEEGCCSPPRMARVITSLRDMDGHWAEREAELVTSLGIMDTLPGHRFGPDSAITRAEYIRMIGLALGCPSVVVTVPFKDVRKTEWFYADVMKGLDSGIVLGTDGRYLRPNALITREEAAVMLARALVHCGRTEVPSDYVARLMLASFKDGDDVSGPALRSMALVVYYDIMVGQNSTNLAPKANLTRAEGALTLSRFWYWLVRRG